MAPGPRIASATSIFKIDACAWGERKRYAGAWPGRLTSSAYCPLPVSSRASSRRGIDLPIPFGDSFSREVRNDIRSSGFMPSQILRVGSEPRFRADVHLFSAERGPRQLQAIAANGATAKQGVIHP